MPTVIKRTVVDAALALLGCRVTDRVTGLQGVASSVTLDLYGCVQVIVTPPVDAAGKPQDAGWYDVKRLSAGERVMAAPAFDIDFGDEPGPGDRPRHMPR